MDIKQILSKQRTFFASGATKEAEVRLRAIDRLSASIKKHEQGILQALQEDLHKSATEAYMTEIGMALTELTTMRKNLRQWSRVQYVSSPLAQFPSQSFIQPEPYGVVLIMSPWNYPFLLAIQPLIGALAAGNCCVVKPSAYAPKTSLVIKKIIREALPEKYAAVVIGGREENAALLEERFDYIFFTGGVTVGKLVMEKASAHLTPVTLELGGKSPCIVEKSARIDLAAKRIVFGKYLNAGQTCVAPDYVLIDRSVKDEFLACVKKWITKMYGSRPLENPDYPRIVNEKHFKRILNLLKGEKILMGGSGNPETLQITPTVVEQVTKDSPLMQEEIFGPVLPVLTYENLEEAEEFIQSREKPLALYLFTERLDIENRILNRLSFGGGCINDTIIHVASDRLAFGGVGQSGMGSYHGKQSFQTFSHYKSIVKKSTKFDTPLRYYPYNKLKDTIVRAFLR